MLTDTNLTTYQIIKYIYEYYALYNSREIITNITYQYSLSNVQRKHIHSQATFIEYWNHISIDYSTKILLHSVELTKNNLYLIFDKIEYN